MSRCSFLLLFFLCSCSNKILIVDENNQPQPNATVYAQGLDIASAPEYSDEKGFVSINFVGTAEFILVTKKRFSNKKVLIKNGLIPKKIVLSTIKNK